jgi:hypothetical protein
VVLRGGTPAAPTVYSSDTNAETFPLKPPGGVTLSGDDSPAVIEGNGQPILDGAGTSVVVRSSTAARGNVGAGATRGSLLMLENFTADGNFLAGAVVDAGTTVMSTGPP